MDFVDQLRQLASRAQSQVAQLKTEEATKHSLILPFINLLGYNIFDPEEVVPEYTADVGTKKGEKVDYAILVDGQPAILIEAKECSDPLVNHDAQLFRYFTTTPAKFAVLTNGIRYKFYSDLQDTNKMDELPFLEFDLFNMKESTVQAIRKFEKKNFNAAILSTDAEIWMFTTKIKTRMETLFKTPDDEFIRYWAKEAYSGKITQAVLDKFTPIVKSALLQFMAESISETIQTALKPIPLESETTKPDTQNSSLDGVEGDNKEAVKIHTTDEELEAYYLIKALMHEVLPPEKVTYRDYATFFAILVDGAARKRVCRLGLEGSKKWIAIPKEDKTEQTYSLESMNDIFSLKQELLESAKRLV